MFKRKMQSLRLSTWTKLTIHLLALFVPLVAFAQSIVLQTEIAGQTRAVQSRDDRVRLIVPSSSVRQWHAGRMTAIGRVTKVDQAGVEVLLIPGKSLREALASASLLGVTEISPVFIEQRDAARVNLGGLREYRLTSKILVEAINESSARRAMEVSGALSFYSTIAKGRWMLVFPNARAVIDGYTALKAAGIKARPQFSMPAYKRSTTQATPNDPLYGQQWHLKNTGQGQGIAGIDANVEPVWAAGNRGANQVIAIVDDGLEVTHPDLMTNVLPLGGDFQTSNHWNFNAVPPNNNPADLNRTPGMEDSHGTSCAGVAAARQNNETGVSGSGPEAGLIGLRLIAGDITDENASAALAWRPAIVTISSNSWGYDDDNSVTAGGPDVMARASLENGVAQGRGGRGFVYLVAGGNGGTPNYRGRGPGIDESNYDSFANSVYVIGVGGNNDKGQQNFSEAGCNLLLTAPTGGLKNDQNITTTTLLGIGNIANFPDYTDGFGGTSSSTPLVAGVVALMLTANPQLGWRDVKEILIRTARKIDDENGGYQTNGAGLPFRFSNRYGAGMVDANAAVTMAQTWTNLGPQVSNSRESGAPSIDIPDNSETGASRTFDFSGTNMRVEFVQFTVDITHPFRGELEYTLTSPSGMRAVVNRRTNDNTADLQWTFGDSQHWGEQSNGTWTLEVRDRMAGNTGTFNSATVKIYGTSAGGTTPTQLGNISTRLRVETDPNALIGGFIVTGTQSKRVIIRAIGPSLPLPDVLADPTLELRDGAGQLIRANDDWRSDQEQEIIATTIPPASDFESAIVENLPANGANYTAIVRGYQGSTGVGLIEAYDLDRTVDSKMANISTRGLVQTGNNVLIAGTIVLGTAPQRVIVRGIGPSLGLQGQLEDPTLELRDGNGTVLRANDNWRSDQEQEIIATTIPPSNDMEAALVHTLPGNGATYTAILRGANNTTGIAVIEIYALNMAQ